jgi:ABC-type nitrate/sulfonate/bicarbonate transport system permease component
MKTPDDPLDALLSQWQVQGEASPSFQREVWNRIATGEADPSLLERFFINLLRPRGWLIASAAAVVVGASIAWMETTPDHLNPHDAYVRSISPFASLHVASH